MCDSIFCMPLNTFYVYLFYFCVMNNIKTFLASSFLMSQALARVKVLVMFHLCCTYSMRKKMMTKTFQLFS